MGMLEGKVCLITGAASNPGIGHSIAHLFADHGATLVLTDIDESGLEKTAAEVSAKGVEVAHWHQNVTDEGQWIETMGAIEQRFGRLDVCVNNAGIAILKALEEMTLADYNRQMDVNMTSVFLGTQKAVVLMRKHRTRGSVINMSSLVGLVGVPNVSAYGASKGGVRLFSKTVALETARDGIRCNTIHPGLIDTNIQQASVKDNPEVYEQLQQAVPMGYMGKPIEVARAALFLASELSDYITGSEIHVDGGMAAQ